MVRVPRVRAPALCAAALVLTTAASAARAEDATDTELRGVGQADVRERAARYTIELDGLIARVTLTTELVAPEGPPAEAQLTFALPREAVPVEAHVAEGARRAVAIGVDADSAITPVRDPDALPHRPDLGLLRRVAWPARFQGEASAGWHRWELAVFPVTSRGLTASVTWLAPVRYADGRLELRLPARTGGRLADATVDLAIEAPRGASGLDAVTCGARTVARTSPAKGRWRCGALGGRELVVSAIPTFADDRPRARTATAVLDPTTTVLGVELVVPPATARRGPRWERVVVLVDTSRSLGAAGARTARDLVHALLASLSAQTAIDVVTFDRGPTSLLGGLIKGTAAARAKVDGALRGRRPGNGSDLAGALRVASRALAIAARRDPSGPRGGDPTTLIAVISDGLTPTSMELDELVTALGEPLAAEAHVAAIVIHPEATPPPPTEALALGRLAARVGGQTLLLPDLVPPARIAAVVAALDRPLPFSTPELELGAAIADGLDLPSSVAPGSGVVRIGRTRGPLPAALAVVGRRRAKDVTVPAERGDAALARAMSAFWLARADVEDLVPPSDRLDPGATYGADVWGAARRKLILLAARAGAATADVALVVLDPADPFAAARLDGVKRFGPAVFQRLAPPPERLDGRELRPQARASSTPRRAEEPATTAARALATGELDLPIVRRVVRGALLPLAKTCYDQSLRGAPTFGGSLELRLELSRGELTSASITRSTLTGARGTTLERCVVDAAQGIDVPRVAVGDLPDDITIARYPLTFRVVGGAGDVSDDRALPAPVPRDPLGGLPTP